MNTKNSEFLAKGTYGCVFYPSIDACSGTMHPTSDSDHYITKIQLYFPEEDDEITIGKQIQKLPLYDQYFAPILKSCKMNVSAMDYGLVKVCATMQNELGELDRNSEYVSNKIRYVGKHNLYKYFQNLKSTPQKLYVKLLNTHLHLLDAMFLLRVNHIVHFDIKLQNIIYDEIQNVPIIIDFGLSRSMKPLLEYNWKPLPKENVSEIPETPILEDKRFRELDHLMRKTFVSDTTYDYWCIDIYILSNIGLHSFLKPNDHITMGEIKTLTNTFITPIFSSVLDSDEIVKFKHRILDYFTPFIEEDKKWIDMYKILVQNYNTWDNYSIALTYLYSYTKCKPIQIYTLKTPEPHELQLYISFLKRIIIAMPNERPSHEETYYEIKHIIGASR